jgi:hypothetical protein
MSEISDFVLCPKCNEYFVGTVSSTASSIAASIALRVADAAERDLQIKAIHLSLNEYLKLREYIMQITGQPREEVEVISTFMNYPVVCEQFIDGMFLELKQ